MSDMTLRLIRTENTEDGVFGKLIVPGHSLGLHTVEDDWRGNRRGVSCIPAGTYPLRRTIYYKYRYETFEVTVPGRSRILIHPANTEEDVQGCIGLGVRRGYLWVKRDEDTGALNVKKRAVVASREAFALFMQWMAGVDEATLIVEWASGEPERWAA